MQTILKINPDREYLPSEIAKLGLIRSRLNTGSYNRVLRLIKVSKLRAMRYDTNAKKPYWMVKGQWIIDYLNRYEPDRFRIELIKESWVRTLLKRR